jgi:hypothetical protein
MRTTRRIRNVAFLGLLIALIWAGPVTLRADSGGFYCGYGDCVLTYDNCFGTWTYYSYPDYGLTEPGSCFIIYERALCQQGGGGDCSCYINLADEGGYWWSVPGQEDCPGSGQYCFACNQL